jgi:hypothetical protein
MTVLNHPLKLHLFTFQMRVNRVIEGKLTRLIDGA